MALIIATGSNQGDPLRNLEEAQNLLSDEYQLTSSSMVYRSKAVDYLDQPDFFNQVHQFEIPEQSPQSVMQNLLQLEQKLGRKRDIPKGPRIIDLDIIFWGLSELSSQVLEIPHPRLFERSFVVRPLSELPYYQTLITKFTFPASFEIEAYPL